MCDSGAGRGRLQKSYSPMLYLIPLRQDIFEPAVRLAACPSHPPSPGNSHRAATRALCNIFLSSSWVLRILTRGSHLHSEHSCHWAIPIALWIYFSKCIFETVLSFFLLPCIKYVEISHSFSSLRWGSAGGLSSSEDSSAKVKSSRKDWSCLWGLYRFFELKVSCLITDLQDA